MTLRKFFVGQGIGFLVLIIVGVSYFTYRDYLNSPTTEVENIQEEATINKEAEIYAWRFAKADTLNLDGNPNTNIFLEITYSNGGTEEKLIDTTHGSCNEIPDTNEDITLNSKMIQCYAAGLGHRYKITTGSESHMVERKTFEEAIPDYEPPEYEYEVVAEFPFSG
ncbi:MAG: hypothetical protein ACK42D_00190 [Candidatus Paceibacteria bacterium]